MQSSASLYCVPPKSVPDIWPHVVPNLKAAIEKTNISDWDEIERDALRGRFLVWIAWDGTKIEASALTELVKSNNVKACVLVAVGGTNMPGWIGLLSQIESFAKDESCSCVRIVGRKGWARLLDGYDMKYAILERPL